MTPKHPDLVAYLGGTLSSAAHARTRAHLETCQACRRHFSTMTEAERYMATAQLDLPCRLEYEHLARGVMAGVLQARPSERKNWWWFVVPATAVASMALVLFVVTQRAEFQQRSDQAAALTTPAVSAMRAFCHRGTQTTFVSNDALSCSPGGAVVVAARCKHTNCEIAHFWLFDPEGQSVDEQSAVNAGESIGQLGKEQVLARSIDLNAKATIGDYTLMLALCPHCTREQAWSAIESESTTVTTHRLTVHVHQDGP